MQTVKLISLFCMLFAFQLKAISSDIQTPKPQNTVKFTENKNQWAPNILYRADLDGGVLFLERNSFTYNFYDKETWRSNHGGGNKKTTPGPVRTHAFRTTFVNALETVVTTAKQITTDYSNYYLGKDKTKWAGHVRNFREVSYKELYRGIDLQVLSFQNSMKYNFIVEPNANANNIRLNYEGLDELFLRQGELVLRTSLNEIIEQKPYAYQMINGKQVEVACEFVLKNNTVSFNFPAGFDKSSKLIIDPVLVFACSSGSLSDNFGMAATYDSLGNLYSGGTCFGVGFPTTLGAYDDSFNGSSAQGITDVVITKYSADGTSLEYSTYLGGAASTEIVTSLIVDAQNNLLLYGATGSSDFPVTSNAFDTSFNGGTQLRFVYNGSYFDNGTDIYVSKFNSSGTSLLSSTYLGGGMNDGVNVNNDSTLFMAGPPAVYEFPADSLQYNYGDQYRGEIQVDAAGNCYIASSTRSGNFPIVGGFDNTLGGKQDAVIIKLNSDFSSLIWSSYLGGTDNDAGYSLILGSGSEVYVTGGTRSNDFPSTAGAYQTMYGGGKADGFVARISPGGGSILQATYIGTNDYDQTFFVQNDSAFNVYLLGQSLGSMPVINAVYSNANAKQFIIKFNNTLSTVLFSTTLGSSTGAIDLSPSAFLVDSCSNIYLTGWGGRITPVMSTMNSMPITFDALQPTTDGHDFYLMVLSADASSLTYATYFGGSQSWEHVDGGTSRFDKKGVVYQSVCAGCGANDDFPVTPGAWPNTGTDVNHSFNCNNGTFKLDFQTNCSLPTNTQEIVEANSILIFPNPNSGKFIIQHPLTGKGSTIEIFNLLGEQIYHSDLQKNTTEVNLSDVAKGIYFLKMNVGTEKYSQKIMIQ